MLSPKSRDTHAWRKKILHEYYDSSIFHFALATFRTGKQKCCDDVNV